MIPAATAALVLGGAPAGDNRLTPRPRGRRRAGCSRRLTLGV